MRRLAIAIAISTLAVVSASAAESLDSYRLLRIDGHYVKWGRPIKGLGATVTYGVVTKPMTFPRARNCGAVTAVDGLLAKSGLSAPEFAHEVATAFAAWETVADITFTPAATAATAEILIGAQARPRDRAYTNVAYSRVDGSLRWAASSGRDEALLLDDRPDGASARRIDRALICLNPRQSWKIGFDGNAGVYDLRYVIAHEIGHAIGLDHPGPAGQVMSFIYSEASRRLQAGDILGAVTLYGPNPAAAQRSLRALTPALD